MMGKTLDWKKVRRRLGPPATSCPTYKRLRRILGPRPQITRANLMLAVREVGFEPLCRPLSLAHDVSAISEAYGGIHDITRDYWMAEGFEVYNGGYACCIEADIHAAILFGDELVRLFAESFAVEQPKRRSA